MNLLVVDNSVTMTWLFPRQLTTPDAKTLSAETLRVLRDGYMVVPQLWGLEVANALAVAPRKGAVIPAPDERRFLDLLSALPTEIEPHEPARALGDILPLARRHQLTAYDATYLELALRRRLPLSSLDEPLRDAMRREGGSLFEG